MGLAPKAWMKPAKLAQNEDIEGSEEGCRAKALAVVRHGADPAMLHRQPRQSGR